VRGRVRVRVGVRVRLGVRLGVRVRVRVRAHLELDEDVPLAPLEVLQPYVLDLDLELFREELVRHRLVRGRVRVRGRGSLA
tara:strand:+ start:207 stop:449 length:243 start_codon:yes stop_codon:yes gene_type:complete